MKVHLNDLLTRWRNDGTAFLANAMLFVALFYFRPDGWQTGVQLLAAALALSYFFLGNTAVRNDAFKIGSWQLTNFTGLLLAAMFAYKVMYPCAPGSVSCPLTSPAEIAYVAVFCGVQVAMAKLGYSPRQFSI